MLYNEPIGFKNSCGVKATLESIAYYPCHMHDGILEVICVLDGKYEIACDAYDHLLSYGDVYFFNSNNSHKIKKADHGNCILLTVHIDLNHYKSYFKNFDGSENYDIMSDFFICDSFRHENKYSLNEKYLRFLLAKLYMEYSSGASELSIENITRKLISYCLLHYHNYFYASTRNGKHVIIQRNNDNKTEDKSNRIYRIIDYIYDHSREKTSLDDIATVEYLNPSYLSSYIKKKSGLNFSEILSIARCEDAQQLLGKTDKTLDQIAREVGFSNRNHLTNQFKKWFHKTPSQYRSDLIADFSEDSTIQFDTFDYDFAKLILDSYLDGY